MGWEQICREKGKLFMEAGLAVLLAAVMSISGARLAEDRQAREEAIRLQKAEEENRAARAAAGTKTETGTKARTETGTGTEAEAEKDKEPEEVGESAGVIDDGQYPIMGSSDITAQQLAAYFGSGGVPYPSEELAKGGAGSIEAFCQIYCEEAQAEGVRPEVAFAQSMKETGWLQFGGDASIGQFNFAGLGTTGGGVPGNSYPDVRTGVRAQIQHLKAYATTEKLSGECVDDRYGYVIKGSAPYVEWLGKQENPQGQGWAVAEDYGNSIVSMIHQIEQIE